VSLRQQGDWMGFPIQAGDDAAIALRIADMADSARFVYLPGSKSEKARVSRLVALRLIARYFPFGHEGRTP
jgi:hypothetical protein